MKIYKPDFITYNLLHYYLGSTECNIFINDLNEHHYFMDKHAEIKE